MLLWCGSVFVNVMDAPMNISELIRETWSILRWVCAALAWYISDAMHIIAVWLITGASCVSTIIILMNIRVEYICPSFWPGLTCGNSFKLTCIETNGVCIASVANEHRGRYQCK